MTPELMFSLCGTVALVGWISLAAGILLRNALLRDTMAGLAIPLALSTAYAVLILVFWWTAEGGFDSLANVQKLFTSPWVALGGWVHYLSLSISPLAPFVVAPGDGGAGCPRLVPRSHPAAWPSSSDPSVILAGPDP